MQAVIMAGGRGSRLMPLTKEEPKPMVKLIDKPVMEYVLLWLKKHGFFDVAVTLGYKPEKIRDYFGDGQKFGMKITYFVEDSPLGTAGGVKNCAEYLTEKDFVVVSADCYTEIDLSRAVRFHKNRGSLFTLVCRKVLDATGLGVLEKDSSGVIKAFVEKPEGRKDALINTGVYVCDRRVLDMIPEGPFDFGKDLLPALVGTAYAIEDDAYWSDIGTLESYYDTNKKLAKELAFV
ncbi:MAG: nucleotidyltransferase family protein [Clostridia bacterium]|nr:nucleotidyltransferase family protein [Clostridia bacterium]